MHYQPRNCRSMLVRTQNSSIAFLARSSDFLAKSSDLLAARTKGNWAEGQAKAAKLSGTNAEESSLG